MKFLAILRDSVREAIDAKVFYVMVGLSLLLVLLAATITVKPVGEAGKFMEMAAVPVNIELKESDLAFQDPNNLLRRLMSRGDKGIFRVTGVEAVEGAANHPGSRYRVLLRGQYSSAEKAQEIRTDPDEALTMIREQFGNLLGNRLVEVTDVQLGGRQEESDNEVNFEVMTAPTQATRRLWRHNFSILFGLIPLGFLDGLPLGAQLFIVEGYLVNGIGAWVAVLVSIIITAFFIPNMLRKGTVDMLIVKPIHRSTLLVYKYVGGLAFIFLNTALAVGGVWLALGLRTGVWAPGFLVSILVITFFFAILYSASALFGVLTRSPIAAILLTCGTWFALFLVGVLFQIFEAQVTDEGRRQMHEAFESGKPADEREPFQDDGLTPNERRARQNVFQKGIRVLHAILPRTSDLDQLMNRYLMSDLLFANPAAGKQLDPTPVNWRESVGVSLAFIAVMLGLGCWWFATRDY